MPGLGCLPPTLDVRDQAFHFATLALPTVKPTALPVQTALPPWKPLDQNGYGTCTAEATLLALVIAYHKKYGRWLYKNSTEAQRAAETLYVEATGDRTKQVGAELRPLMAHAKNVGILLPDGRRVKAASYHCLIPAKDVRADIEAAIAAGMAVVTAWYWPKVWMVAHPPFDTLPTPKPNAPLAGGHAIVAWRAAMKHPSAGASTLRRDHALAQSWGEEVGNDGVEYVNAALEVKGWLFDAWVLQAA
jgi:hypothetical protein